MISIQDRKWLFPQAISRWDEALPLGNGQIGSLIWGSSDALRLSLDRTDVWDTTPSPLTEKSDFTYENLIRLVKNQNWKEIDRLFDAPYHSPTPTKLPVGKLIFHFEKDLPVSSLLDIERAEAVLHIGDNEMRVFLHAEQKTGYILLSRGQFPVYTLESPPFHILREGETRTPQTTDSLNTSSLECLSYPAPHIHETQFERSFIQPIQKNFLYGVFVRQKENLMVFCILTGTSERAMGKEAEEKLSEALQQGYDAAFQSHHQWWKKYYAQSGLRVPDALFERNWYLAQYFLACCSRKGCAPMPLQGVWTADDGKLPPWKGDYHHDLNTQVSYTSYLKANHAQEGESFLDFLWALRGAAKDFAKKFYHASGQCLPTIMGINGEALSGWVMYAFSPTGQLWLGQLFARHADAMADETFLRERAYPYLKESAECVLSLLKEDGDGYLRLPLSASPEIHDDCPEAWMTPNTNYDLALMRYTFTKLLGYAKKIAPEDVSRWKKVLQHLQPLHVAKNHVLKVSENELLTQSHRHFSHLMAIWPLKLLKYDQAADKEIIDACILDQENLGTGQWVGYSFAWMAELYAIAKNGTGAAFQLEMFWRFTCSPNGFHLNGDFRRAGISTFHYRPFTLESNFLAADALQEMLLYAEDGTVELFPAVPPEWKAKKLSFQNFLCPGGVRISAEMAKGVITRVQISAPAGTRLHLRDGTAYLDAVTGKNMRIKPQKQNLICQFDS